MGAPARGPLAKVYQRHALFIDYYRHPVIEKGKKYVSTYPCNLCRVNNTHECFKMHNEVTGVLVQLRGRNRFVGDLSAWPLEAISVCNS